MSNQDQKHDWRPGLVAGASDLPVGVISGAGGAAAADAILKKKLQSAPPERLARLEKLHGRVSHLGTGLIAGGAALAYADYMQRKHEQELAEAKMSKVAQTGNIYLEKVAEQLTAEQQKALDRGYDRPWVQSGIHGLVGGMAGNALAIPAMAATKSPAAALIGTAGTIAGVVHGYTRANKNNAILDNLRETDKAKVDDVIIRDGKKSHLAGFFGSPFGIPGVLDTAESNKRYQDVVASRLGKKE